MKRLLTYLLLVLGMGLMFTNFASALPECKGTIPSMWTNCYGTYAGAKGKYAGEWKDGDWTGQGTVTWASGKFAGDKYVGEVKDGLKHGQGTYTFADGEKYVGEFKKVKPNGQGTFTSADGDKYVGEFKNGKQHGQGTFTLDGKVIKGIWKKGKRQ